MSSAKSKNNIRGKEGRYILMLADASEASLHRVQDELQVKLTSSEELSARVRAAEVLQSDQGIFYKNIGIAVVDKVEADQLVYASSMSSNKIVHWEADRVFQTAGKAFESLDKIKTGLEAVQDEIKALELVLQGDKVAPVEAKEVTWGLEAMGINASKYSGKGVDLCVLDTGFYLSHPDFKGRSIIGKSFIPGEPWEYDGDGHGTHCTGIAAGYLSLNSGVRYGIAYGANIVIGKVLGDDGFGTTSNIIDAIDWALEKKFSIISMSLASAVDIGEKPSPIFEQAGQKALDQNTLIIAAAGNDSARPQIPRPVSSPANADAIMAVGAVDEEMKVARFSNGGINASGGGKVDLVAPGVHILSSYSKNAKDKLIYKYLDGTSMSAPHIAGLAALYREADPRLTARGLWEKLEQQALKLEDLLKRDVGFGLGHCTS